MRKSSFAGFLDGYKSSNIASNESVINYKIDEILDLLKGINSLVDDAELNHIFNRNISLLQQKRTSDLVDILVSFGESLKSNINLLNKISEGNGNIKEKVRKIVLNFAELAKMSEDGVLINIAINLGSNFKY